MSTLSSRGTQTSGRPSKVLMSSTATAPPRSWSEPSGALGPLMPAEKPILIGSPLAAAGAAAAGAEVAAAGAAAAGAAAVVGAAGAAGLAASVGLADAAVGAA